MTSNRTGDGTSNRTLNLIGLAGALLIVLLIVGAALLYADHMRAYIYIEPPRQEFVSEGAAAVREQRAAEQEALRSYGWVDEEGGVIRVPINLAMDLTTQRGADFVFALPEPAAPAVAAAPAAPAVTERFNLVVGEGDLPVGANFVTVRFSYPEGDVVTRLEMPAPIERVEVAGTSGGELAAAAPGDAPVGDAAGVAFDWEATGERAYNTQCAACHQANGQGIPGAFPPLAGHMPDLYNASRNYSILVLLYGLVGEIVVEGQTYNGLMPAFNHLSDEDIAAILNHSMTSWGNDAELVDFEPYVPADVAAERGANLSPQDVYALRQGLGLE